MSNVFDRVLADICLDERISDGIFRMDDEEHMNALREYFVKKGLTKEDSIRATNKMLEGRFPDRQAYRAEDGILVTWPSQKHKVKAMRENPGKYVEENPFPKKPTQYEPDGKPDQKDVEKEPATDTDKSDPESDQSSDADADERPGASLFNNNQKIQQGNKQLSIEPISGTPTAQAQQAPQAPPPPIQKNPTQIAAEKELVSKMIKQGDSVLTDFSNPLMEAYDANIRQQVIKEFYKKADELGLKEVVTFLTPYVKL